MQRRTFLALLAALPITSFVVKAEQDSGDNPLWFRRNFEPIDPQNSLLGIYAMAMVFPNESAATDVIDQLSTVGFLQRSGTPAAHYPEIEVLPIPEEIDLPAALRRYKGAAPVSSGLAVIPYVTLDVQRENYIVTLTLCGTEEADLVQIVTDLMLITLEYDVPTGEPIVDDSGRHSGGVWDVMLQEEDASTDFRLYQESDENGVVQISN